MKPHRKMSGFVTLDFIITLLKPTVTLNAEYVKNDCLFVYSINEETSRGANEIFSSFREASPMVLRVGDVRRRRGRGRA